jgi:hypothetical protein
MHTSLEDTEIPCDNCVCIVKFCAAVGTVQFMMETNITTVSFLDREAVKWTRGSAHYVGRSMRTTRQPESEQKKITVDL